MARDDQEPDRWPSFANGFREPNAVHRTRHPDICEDNADILSGFEYSDGLIGIARKQRMQSRILDEVVRHQEEHWFILDDQDATATRRALLWHISPF
jgi:hypothetical protein